MTVLIGGVGEGSGAGEYRPTPVWHKKYPCCVACGTTDRPHASLGMCQPCYSPQYYLEHREKISDYYRAYRRADPARHLARVHAWREANHERYLEQSRVQQRERYWRQRAGLGTAEGPPADQQVLLPEGYVAPEWALTFAGGACRRGARNQGDD